MFGRSPGRSEVLVYDMIFETPKDTLDFLVFNKGFLVGKYLVDSCVVTGRSRAG
jgi:hypothetical protein